MFSLDVAVTTKTRDDAWRIDCFLVALSAKQNSGLHHSFSFCLRVTKNSDCLPEKFTVLGIWGLFESGGLVGCFNVRLSYAFPVLCEEKKLTFLWRALHNHPVGLHSY